MTKISANSQALGEEDITRLLWRFSLPAIIGLLVNALYNVVDSIFVGNGVGAIGLTAVTIAFPLMIVMMGGGMLVGVGAATLVSLRLGEQKPAEAEKILGQALALSLIIGTFSSALGLFFLDPLLLLLGAEADVMPYARDFTRIILWGSLPLYLSFGLNNLIRAAGDPRTAMATMLIAALLNVGLNPLFIFELGLGIKGSALATVLAQSVAAAWVLAFFTLPPRWRWVVAWRRGGTVPAVGGLRLRWENIALEGRLVQEIFRIGLSPFLMQIGASIIIFLYNYRLLQFGGEVAVAAIGVINRVAMLMLMPVFGINQGVQPIIGYNYGAGRLDRVSEAAKKAVFAATGICTLGFVITELFAPQLMNLFSADPELALIGTPGMRINFCLMPVIGFQIICASYFQAVGQARQAIFLTLSRQVILVIPLLLILPVFFGVNGIWATGPLSDIGSAILTVVCLQRERRRLARERLALTDDTGRG